MTFRSFDVVIVPFPFTDRPATKRRPALVMSSDAFNRGHEHVILAMITTATHSSWPSDIEISDPEPAGLRTRSIVRLKLFTVEQDMVLRTLGQLSQRDRESVLRNLRSSLCWQSE